MDGRPEETLALVVDCDSAIGGEEGDWPLELLPGFTPGTVSRLQDVDPQYGYQVHNFCNVKSLQHATHGYTCNSGRFQWCPWLHV